MISMKVFLDEAAQIIGAQYVISDTTQCEAYGQDYRQVIDATPLACFKPKTTQEVAELVKLCQSYGVVIVPQGGNTSLVAGAVPSPKDVEPRAQVVLSLSRMDAIRHIDTSGNSVTVEAGCILSVLKDAVTAQGRFFPLALASEGSCQIGGNIAANAGGSFTIGYGNMREQVLGLEVVLSNGDVLSSLKPLRKDNTGYDLKQIFIGSEGTLGIITAATLRLYPQPSDFQALLCAVPSAQAAIGLLSRLQDVLSDVLIAYELISAQSLTLCRTYINNFTMPIATDAPWYVFADIKITQGLQQQTREILEQHLSQAVEDGLLLDAIFAESAQQRQALWQLREDLPEAERMARGSLKHDISVAVADIPAFLEQANQAIKAIDERLRISPFGHAGDGNLHYNIVRGEEMTREAFMGLSDKIEQAVFDMVHQFDGSIAAEHGVGQLKQQKLAAYKDPVALTMMQQLKRSLDPSNIFNPGKVISIDDHYQRD